MHEMEVPSIPTSDSTAAQILSFLTVRQHLHPHALLSELLEQLSSQTGCCPRAISEALNWLKIDSAVRVGRLRRTELNQLARAIHRYWMRQADSASVE